MGYLNVKFMDYSLERSSARIPIANGTAEVDRDAIIAALVGITIGTRGEVNFTTVVQDEVDNLTPPASQFAQRESKWLVTYTDDVNGDIGQFEIPTADLLVLAPGGDVADTGNAQVAAFITALNTHGVSRDGNAITVSSIRHVGRNL